MIKNFEKHSGLCEKVQNTDSLKAAVGGNNKLVNHIMQEFRPSENCIDMAILYEIEGYQCASEQFDSDKFWDNYNDKSDETKEKKFKKA